MTKKPVKRCSTSLTMREMQIKITVTFYVTHTKMAIIKKTKNKVQKMPIAGKDIEKSELSYTAGGMQNGTAILEKSLKVKYRVTIRSSNPVWRYVTQRNERMSTKNSCMNAYRSIIYNSENIETTSLMNG